MPNKPITQLWRIFSAALCLGAMVHTANAQEQKQGQWDGVTPMAELQTPYEDPRQAPPTFGILSYFNLPWRGYMDTWPASKWLQLPGVGWTGDPKYHAAQAQLMSECGIRFVRIEIGWSNLGWDDELLPHVKERLTKQLSLCKQYGLRPLILLNAHHGVPVPLRSFETQLVADAAPGARTIKIKPDTKVREGYTGLVNQGDYKAAFPLITKLDADGTAHLSAPLPKELKAGKLPLQELKYQPLQGARLKNAPNGQVNSASQETLDGWLRYARAAGNFVREQLGTPADAGFDIEVWNELTFGSDFLDINRYYEPKLDLEPLLYKKTRAWTPQMRPDAQLEFEQRGFEVLLPLTIDFFNDPKNGFKNVAVISGFSNQWPWGSGATMWHGQGGLSKHYYTGSTLREVSPQMPLGKKDSATVDALGQFDGKKDPNNREWHGILPGSNFVPQVTLSQPEWMHGAFQTETIQRDLYPDSRLAKGIGNTPSGRYTNNGDRKIPRYWQTEVNYDRSAFIERVKKESGAKDDNPRLIALNDWTNSKHMLRQYVFHCHKGFERIFLFSTAFDDFSIGLLPNSFYKALDASNYQLTPEVRKTVPVGWTATKWITDLMKTGEPLDITRALTVTSVVEHKPRLVFKGDGTSAHPSKYHRDYLAILPFQLSPQKFAIAYYVSTPNATQTWDETKDPLDPARYDLPPQMFDVTFGNLAARGVKISAFDPLKNQAVPVQIMRSVPASPSGGAGANLPVRLLATDYPRFLIIEEATPGPQITMPQIVMPQITATADNATLHWKTNIAPVSVKVTYGRDWPQRDVNSLSVPIGRKGQRDFSVMLPVGGADTVAARIKLTASDGRTITWPRWDEDPAGQITLPGAKSRPANQTGGQPVRQTPPVAELPLVNFEAPIGVTLPVATTAYGVRFSTPASASRIVSNDVDQTVLWHLGRNTQKVILSASFQPRSAKNAEDYLPFASPIDVVTRRRLKLPSGLEALAVDFVFDLVAHPGLAKDDLHQCYLLIPRQDNLVILRASGTPTAIASHARTIDAIWASVKAE